MIKVTVGICVKNSEKTIKETIRSIINQDFSHDQMEIIVVDGDSKDKTVSIIKESISKTDIQVKIYSDNGRGLGAARQMVVDNANGKYIVWIDGDIVVTKDLILKHVDFMEQNPHVGIAVGKMMLKQENSLLGTLDALYEYTIEGRMGASSAIYRLKSIREVGGFDKNIKGASEDSDIERRIKANGWSISINEEAKWYHNCRETLTDLWNKRFWFAYGDHFMHHKHGGKKIRVWNYLPFLFSIGGFRHSLRAYKQTHLKKSFLLPLLCFFESIAWLFGFIEAHIDGYGHTYCY